MVIVGELLALAGLLLLVVRLRVPARRGAPPPPREAAAPLVSIVVPARDEEQALPRLLASLARLDYPAYEVIVVDDCSSDRTAVVAEQAGARVVRGKPRPQGWNGKQWACMQGAAVAQGDWLLFTDADTWHEPTSLTRMMEHVTARRLGMASALPYHEGEALWERLLGPFHLLLLAVTAPLAPPTPERKFAIGQYLLFSRAAYAAVEGHAGVRGALVEDLPLARRALERGVAYGVYTEAPLFRVRMYTSLADFIRGWRRNFRAGFADSPWSAPLEVGAVMAALTGGGHVLHSPSSALIAAATMAYMMARQGWLGRFSAWGPVLFPFSAAIFCLVSGLALFDRVLDRPQLWKGREFHLEGGRPWRR